MANDKPEDTIDEGFEQLRDDLAEESLRLDVLITGPATSFLFEPPPVEVEMDSDDDAVH